MQVKRFYIWILLFLITGFISFCRSPSDANKTPQDTLVSLKQVADFPLYEMHYYGDYGFREFLNTGITKLGNSSTNRTETSAYWACTCFAGSHSSSDKISGRNFDWHTHPALILFTDPPDGYASVSMVDISYLGFSIENTPTSDSQRLLEAPYLPFDGMNEKGVAVGIMAVTHAEGGNDPAKI